MSIGSLEEVKKPKSESEKAQLEKLSASSSVEVAEINDAELKKFVDDVRATMDQKSNTILQGLDTKLDQSANNMQVSPEMLKTLRAESGLDSNLAEVQSEANALAEGGKAEVTSIVDGGKGIDKSSIHAVDQLLDLNKKISQESNPENIARLKQERLEVTKSYVRSEVTDPRISEVVCHYVDDKNATDIQALLQGGERTKAIIEKIKKTTKKGSATTLDSALQTGERTEAIVTTLEGESKHMEASPSDVDSVSLELAASGSEIFIDDNKEMNINPETGNNKLNEFINLRKQSPEMALSTKEISENPEEVRRVAETLLNQIKESIEPILTKELETITEICRSQGAEVIGKSQRTKSTESLVNKIKHNAAAGKDYAIGDATDLLGGRVVVKDLHSLELVMKQVEDLYGKKGVILEKENKFVKNQGKNNPYRAIHYIIQTEGGNCFELQLKTESSMIASDLYHNAVYKPEILNLSEDQKQAVENYNWQSDYDELLEYKQSRQST